MAATRYHILPAADPHRAGEAVVVHGTVQEGPWVRSRLLSALLGLALGLSAVLAATELVLLDGRTIDAIDVRRDGGNYLVTLEGGDMIALPLEVVKTIRLTGKGTRKVEVTEPGLVAGQAVPEGPSGLRQSEPQTLAGERVRAPTTREQLGVLGPPARFQKGVVDSNWTPSSDWDMNANDPHRNDFAPSTWSKGVVDPTWTPKSAFDANADVLADSRSSFQKGVVDSTWTPTDGFARGRS